MIILSILLFIIKFIGILILGIIGLILLLLLIILFVPIHYEASGHKYEQIKVVGKIHWLFKLLRVRINIVDDKIEYVVKLFYKVLVSEPPLPKKVKIKKKKSKKKIKKKIKKKKVAVEAEKQVPIQVKEIKPIKPIDNLAQNTIKHEEAKKEEAKKEEPKKEEAKKEEAKKNEPKKNEPKKKKAKKDENKSEPGVIDKIKDYYEFIKSPEMEGVFRFLLKRVWRIIKSILPRHLKMYVHFGFNDPASTGYVLATASMFFPIYRKNVKLVPNFHESVLEGEFYGRGKIIIGSILYQALRVYFDKRVRRAIKKFKSS